MPARAVVVSCRLLDDQVIGAASAFLDEQLSDAVGVGPSGDDAGRQARCPGIEHLRTPCRTTCLLVAGTASRCGSAPLRLGPTPSPRAAAPNQQAFIPCRIRQFSKPSRGVSAARPRRVRMVENREHDSRHITMPRAPPSAAPSSPPRRGRCSASCLSNIARAAAERFSVSSSRCSVHQSNDSMRGTLSPEKCGMT